MATSLESENWKFEVEITERQAWHLAEIRGTGKGMEIYAEGRDGKVFLVIKEA